MGPSKSLASVAPLTLRTGKLPPDLLRRLLRYGGAQDRRVLIGPRFGEDAAVVDLGTTCLVLKSDPVTFTSKEVGWYAVHVNANDIAVMGARPAWFQPTIILPPHTPRRDVFEIARDIDRAARSLGVAITGGHTEVSAAVRQAIVAGDMQGVIARKDLVTSAGAEPGDVLIMTGAVGIEGTSILARHEPRATRRLLGLRRAAAAAKFHHEPGISVVRPALAAARAGAKAMHDPTEGGLAMGIVELASASGVGVDLDLDAIPVRQETLDLCRRYGVRPLGLISSGALLIAVAAPRAERLRAALRRAGVKGVSIGRVRRGRGVRAWSSGRRASFVYSSRDELARVFGDD